MATVDDDGYVHGTIGPTSSRNRRGVQTIQTNPGKGNTKQSEGTKKASNSFGIASTFAKKSGQVFRKCASFLTST